MKEMKEDFWMMKEALLAQFKKELDERCIGGTGFFDMKTLMKKLMTLRQTWQKIR